MDAQTIFQQLLYVLVDNASPQVDAKPVRVSKADIDAIPDDTVVLVQQTEAGFELSIVAREDAIQSTHQEPQ